MKSKNLNKELYRVQKEIINKLNQIEKNLMDFNSEEISAGHIGSANYINGKLKEIIKFQG